MYENLNKSPKVIKQHSQLAGRVRLVENPNSVEYSIQQKSNYELSAESIEITHHSALNQIKMQISHTSSRRYQSNHRHNINSAYMHTKILRPNEFLTEREDVISTRAQPIVISSQHGTRGVRPKFIDNENQMGAVTDKGSSNIQAFTNMS